jgi:GNAT superfamily N-acetyltransferase
MRIIVIDEGYRKLGMGSELLGLTERWLRQHGYRKLVVQSSPEAYPFYRKHGYVEMPFEDPHGYKTDPRDIEIGKFLSR